MPLDALCLSHVVAETAAFAEQARIDKIYQPSRQELVLTLRSREGTRRLLLSARPGAARLHFTDRRRENPAEPPMFCMLLRKHLGGGRVVSMTQVPTERMVRICIESMSELGELRSRTLLLEAMGQQANLILLDEQERIIDAMRRVEGDITTGRRQILPGLFYQPPKPVDKLDAASLSREQLEALFQAATPEDSCSTLLSRNIGGLSPLLVRELCYHCGGIDISAQSVDRDKLFATLWGLIVDKPKPTIILLHGIPKDFSFLSIEQYENVAALKSYHSFAELLDRFYGEQEQQEQMRQRGEQLRKRMESVQARLLRKMDNQRRELEKASERETSRIYGDLITSNLYRMSKGEHLLRCENFYNEALPQIEIPLDPLKTPQQNAAHYYKQYNRMKTAEQMLQEQLAQGEQELEYVRSILDALYRADSAGDLAEIRQELEQAGYLKSKRSGKKQQKLPPLKPYQYTSSSGRSILVGRNNIQNEQLSFRQARHTDLWLHVQKAPGSHVILSADGEVPDEQSIAEAAALAVKHSSLNGGGKVPVDYTLVRNLKKVPGGKPGMVIYHKYETIYAQPPQAEE